MDIVIVLRRSVCRASQCMVVNWLAQAVPHSNFLFALSELTVISF